MKLCLVQYQAKWLDVEANISGISRLHNDIPDDCDLVILPEMCTSGFAMNPGIFSSELQKRVRNSFADLAKRCGSALIAGSVESEGKDFFNSAGFWHPDGSFGGSYNKIHPFSYVDEQHYFAGGKAHRLFSHNALSIIPSVCYDIRFPEMYRPQAPLANLIVVIANWPQSRIDQWNALLAARAIENQCFVAGVNRLGVDGKHIQYSGDSGVFSPLGEPVTLQGDPNKDMILQAEIDLAEVEQIRSKFQFLPDMRHNISLK